MPPTSFTGEVIDLPPSPGFWAVTSYELVNEVSRHPGVYSSFAGTISMATMAESDLMLARQMMINMDPPEHSRLRRILQPIFTPRAIQGIHDAVALNAGEIAREFAHQGGGDFVLDVAAELPIRVLADLLGMPRDDRHLIFDWSNTLVGLEDPEYATDLATFASSLAELFGYGTAMAADRRSNPRDDIVSMIANAEVDGERLDDAEFNMFWLLLIVAGNETTRNSLSGGVTALCEHDRWPWLRSHREHLATAVEELIRYVSPVMQMRRTALEDTKLGYQEIRPGDKVVVWYPAANRDLDIFDDPHGLDLERTPNQHLAFGIGPHFCLGAHLARLEIATLLDVLLDECPTLEIRGQAERMHSNFINGVRHLPIRVGS